MIKILISRYRSLTILILKTLTSLLLEIFIVYRNNVEFYEFCTGLRIKKLIIPIRKTGNTRDEDLNKLRFFIPQKGFKM